MVLEGLAAGPVLEREAAVAGPTEVAMQEAPAAKVGAAEEQLAGVTADLLGLAAVAKVKEAMWATGRRVVADVEMVVRREVGRLAAAVMMARVMLEAMRVRAAQREGMTAPRTAVGPMAERVNSQRRAPAPTARSSTHGRSDTASPIGRPTAP